MHKKSWFKLVASSLIGISILLLLIKQLDFQAFLELISGVSLIYIVAGLLVYLTVTIVRAMRFRVLLSNKLGFRQMFSITSVHVFMNFLLPFRAGELSFVFLVKKTGLLSGSEAFASLIVARIFDIVAISIFFLISAFLIKDLPAFVAYAVQITALILAIIILVVLVLVFAKEKFILLIEKLLVKLNLVRLFAVSYTLEKGKSIASYLEILKNTQKMLHTFVYSLIIWGLLYFLAFLAMQSMGVDISFFKVVLGDTFLELSSIFPLYAVGGIGIFEGAWTVAFMALGLPKQIAIASGLGYHLLLLFYISAIGIIPVILHMKRL